MNIISSSVNEDISFFSSSISCATLPLSDRKTPLALLLTFLSIISFDFFSSVNISGLTIPDTIDSPSPQLDSITILSLSPVIGSAVNITPAAFASTMLWTITAIPPSRCDIFALCL